MLRGVKYLTLRLYCYTSVTNGAPQLLGKQWGRCGRLWAAIQFPWSAAIRFQNHQAAAAEDGDRLVIIPPDGNFAWQGAETDDRAGNVGAGSQADVLMWPAG